MESLLPRRMEVASGRIITVPFIHRELFSVKRCTGHQLYRLHKLEPGALGLLWAGMETEIPLGRSD